MLDMLEIAKTRGDGFQLGVGEQSFLEIETFV